jgi:hypothetical protein
MKRSLNLPAYVYSDNAETHIQDSTDDEAVTLPAIMPEGSDLNTQTTVPGFKKSVKLFPHQVACRDFMDIRESGSNFGGILADDNGCDGILVSVTEFNINAILSGQPWKNNFFPCSNYGSTSSIRV